MSLEGVSKHSNQSDFGASKQVGKVVVQLMLSGLSAAERIVKSVRSDRVWSAVWAPLA